MFVLGAGFLASVLFLPLFMVNVVGLSATGSGLTTTPLTLALVVASILAGLFTSRFLHYQPLMLFALALLLVGFTVIGFTLTPASTQLEVGLKMALVGFGLGLQQPLYTLAVQNTAPPSALGAATSTITFVRQIGLTIGTAGFNAVFVMALGANPSKETYTSAIERVYQGGLVLVALGLLFTLFIPNLPLSRRKGETGAAAPAAAD